MKTSGWIFAAALTAATLLPLTVANASTIVSTFDVGNSFLPSIGWTIGGSSSTIPGFARAGMEFGSSGNYNVDQIDLGLGNLFGTNSAVVSLWTESAGLPTTQLGSWTVNGLANFGSNSGTVSTISGITGVSLISGSNYFLVVDAVTASDTWDAWNHNSLGITGLALYDSGTGWQSDTTDPLGAFDVIGTPANPVPEPLTLSLFGAGLAGAVAMRRRKKQAA